MKLPLGFVGTLCTTVALLAGGADAQQLPDSFHFSVSGSFTNPVGQGQNAILIADNDLTDGYAAGMDQTDAPVNLQTSGPAGAAAFQWGNPSGNSSYPHTSALWFEPLSGTNVTPEEYFDLGFLYYRNGTIVNGTAATAVDLAIAIELSGGLGTIGGGFTSNLINTVNTSDPAASADIVSLADLSTPLDYFDTNGNRYYLELTFRVDQNTLDGTLSTPTEFRVFEGMQGRADLIGRITTAPAVIAVPEPSSLALALLGGAAFFRRKR